MSLNDKIARALASSAKFDTSSGRPFAWQSPTILLFSSMPSINVVRRISRSPW